MEPKLAVIILSLILECSACYIGKDTYEPNSLGNAKFDHATVSAYYESLCPDCIREFPQFPKVKSKLGKYVKFHTYPFGNAHLIDQNGNIKVQCQHGEAECYGNKLHACAIELLVNEQAYLEYNACLMAGGSNDTAADSCGTTLKVDSSVIKLCAGGKKGEKLLIYYGKESGKVHYDGVPYVLVNGTPLEDGADILKAVCATFEKSKQPVPPGCEDK